MTPVKDIEQAIKRLSFEELGQFREWFTEYDWQVWDRKIEQDSVSGKLDKLSNKAYNDYASGRTRHL